MENETTKVNDTDCINVTITPLTNETSNIEVETNDETNVETNDEFLNQFSDEPLTEDPNAKKKLNSIIGYLKSSRFKKKVNSEAYKTGIPPKKIAQGVISKAFGIVGDILGIAVDTVSYTLNGLIDLLSSILHSGINLITRVLNGICRIVTFNQTVCAS